MGNNSLTTFLHYHSHESGWGFTIWILAQDDPIPFQVREVNPLQEHVNTDTKDYLRSSPNFNVKPGQPVIILLMKKSQIQP